MTEANGNPEQPERRSPWIILVKVLLYLGVTAIVLIVLVFGTCVLMMRK